MELTDALDGLVHSLPSAELAGRDTCIWIGEALLGLQMDSRCRGIPKHALMLVQAGQGALDRLRADRRGSPARLELARLLHVMAVLVEVVVDEGEGWRGDVRERLHMQKRPFVSQLPPLCDPRFDVSEKVEALVERCARLTRRRGQLGP